MNKCMQLSILVKKRKKMMSKIEDKTYLVPKKGSDGSDLSKTSFVVSPGALEHIKTPAQLHKPLMELKSDNKNDNKIRQELISSLKDVKAWSVHYDPGETFGEFFRKDFKEFLKSYKQDSRLSQKEVSEGKFRISIPTTVKDRGVKYIQQQKQGN